MSPSPLGGITSSLDSLAKEMRKARFTASRAGAEAVRECLFDSFAAEGRARFKGTKLGVEIKQLSQSQGLVVGRAGRSAGAIAIGDEGAKPHVITPKRGKALLVPGAGLRAKVKHPGARGTGMWDKGIDRAEGPCDAEVAREMDRAVEGGF